MNKKKEYRFNPKAHLHEIFDGGEWKPLTGVTTVLSVISKGDALIQWAANMAVKFVEEWVKSHPLPKETKLFVDAEKLLEILEEARTAHRRKKEEAGQKGTDIHAIIETIISQAINDNGGILTLLEHENPQIQHFLKWAQNNKVKFLASELQLYSKELWIGGICDFICKMNKEVWLGDIKTSNNIYPEHFWQTAAYQMMIEEMGLYKIKGHIIVNLRKDGGFEEKRSISNSDNQAAFLSALKIYRIQEKINGSIL